jgi:branched-chain amino acid transport system permease protein
MIYRSQLILLGAIGASLLLSLGSGRMDPYFLDVTITVGINIILAVSLNLINGYTGQFSLGHAGFMAVGAYSAAALTTNFGPALLPLAGGQTWILFPLALLVGGLMAALAGLFVGVPSLRLRGDYLAIVTLGFGEIIKVLLYNVDAVGASRGMVGIPSYTNLFWTFSVAAVTIYVVWALVHSTYGRGFIAVSDDEVAAQAMGINTTRYKITAFVVGAFFAGIAGGIYAHFKQFITPSGFDFNKSIEIVVIVILGGMGRQVGVILAAVVLAVLPEVLRYVPGWLRHTLEYIKEHFPDALHSPSEHVFDVLSRIAENRMILYSALLIALMLTRPQGLFTWPLWRRKGA